MNATANRLQGDDLVCIAEHIAGHLPTDRPASIAEDFNRIMRGAPRSIGLGHLDLRQSECDEIADMIAAAILDHEATWSAPAPITFGQVLAAMDEWHEEAHRSTSTCASRLAAYGRMADLSNAYRRQELAR